MNPEREPINGRIFRPISFNNFKDLPARGVVEDIIDVEPKFGDTVIDVTYTYMQRGKLRTATIQFTAPYGKKYDSLYGVFAVDDGRSIRCHYTRS